MFKILVEKNIFSIKSALNTFNKNLYIYTYKTLTAYISYKLIQQHFKLYSHTINL